MIDPKKAGSWHESSWRTALNMDRRDFVRAAVAGAAVAGVGTTGGSRQARAFAYEPYPTDDKLTTVVTSCAHNCGSRHMLVAHKMAALSTTFNGMAEMVQGTMRELREQEAFLKGLIDTVPDGIRVIDESKRVILVNAALARQVGCSQAELTGSSCWRLHGHDSACSPTLVTCPFSAIATDGEPIRYIHRHVRHDGSEVHVETTAARVTLETSGRPRVLIIEAIRDLEQQIKYSHEQRLSEIGQLAAGVAHEIYNPLASVRIGLQAVVRRTANATDADPMLTHYLDMVDGEVEKCIVVAKRLLDLSQVPSTSIQLVSLSTIVPDVASLLSYEAEQRGVAMTIDLGSDELRVLATDAELRMVVLNLMQNAFHAMPKGGTLDIAALQDARNIVLRFKDSGVGIEPDALPHIFDAFYSRRADGVSGTGLGLTICNTIVRRYRGAMSVASEPGVGSTFTIRLPRAENGMDLREPG